MNIDHDIHSTRVLFSVSILKIKNVNIKGRESIASENLRDKQVPQEIQYSTRKLKQLYSELKTLELDPFNPDRLI